MRDARFRRGLAIAGGTLGLGLTSLLAFWLLHTWPLFDPDRLYHFALLREMETQGTLLLREWAQFPLLGWDQYFSDKEYLYHLFLYLPWRLGHEEGALAAGAFLSAALLWLPFFAFPAFRVRAILASSVFLALNYRTMLRLALLRPHVLAILLFLGLAIACVRRSPRMAFVLALTFALAYHAFYLPAFLAAAALAAGRGWVRYRRSVEAAADPALARTGGAMLGGLAVGILVNPYFPSNLLRALQTFLLAANPGRLPPAVRERLGAELLPFSASEWSLLFAAAVAALLWSAWALRKAERPWWMLSWVTAAFWVVSVKSPRAIEFAMPLTAMVFAAAWSLRPRAGAVVCGLVCLAHGASLLGFVGTFRQPSPFIPPEVVKELLAPLPTVPGKTRVFHSEWGLGAYIAYARPDVAATEVLDPSFLWMSDPARSNLLYELRRGRVGQPSKAIREVFGADYALIESSPLADRLRAEPGVEALASARNGFLTLFHLPRP